MFDEWEEVVDASTLQTLRLRGIFVRYDGINPANTPPTPLQLPAPTVADLQATARWSLTIMPVQSDGVFSSGGTMNWFVPLTGVITPAGDCPDSWASLLAWLNLMRLNDGNRQDVIYYGLLPAGIPTGPVTGCEGGGIAAGSNGDTIGLAHEVGHACGLQHAPCGNARRTDPNYPAYEPYDPANTARASLGEYGLDVSNGTIHRPTERDFMSYCQNWISLYHHAQLSRNERLDPREVGVDRRYEPPELVDPFLWPEEYIPDPPRGPVARLRAQRLITIVGVMDEGRFEMTSVMRIRALPQHSADAAPTAFTAQLIGAGGDVVAHAPLMRLASSPCGCGRGRQSAEPPRRYVVEALLEDVEPGRELRIVTAQGSEELRKAPAILWSRNAPTRPPRIRTFTVKLERGGQGLARWDVSCPSDANVMYALQFSKDRGRSWNGLTVGVSAERYAFSLADLPSGPVVFRLLAHDGFTTVTADSRPIQLPERAPAVTILHPQEGGRYYAGLPLRLWAATMTHDGQPIAQDACSWTIDGKSVGMGTDTIVTIAAPGEHECVLRVRGLGAPTPLRRRFTVVDPANPHLPQLEARVQRATRTARRRRARPKRHLKRGASRRSDID